MIKILYKIRKIIIWDIDVCKKKFLVKSDWYSLFVMIIVWKKFDNKR